MACTEFSSKTSHGPWWDLNERSVILEMFFFSHMTHIFIPRFLLYLRCALACWGRDVIQQWIKRWLAGNVWGWKRFFKSRIDVLLSTVLLTSNVRWFRCKWVLVTLKRIENEGKPMPRSQKAAQNLHVNDFLHASALVSVTNAECAACQRESALIRESTWWIFGDERQIMTKERNAPRERICEVNRTITWAENSNRISLLVCWLFKSSQR